MKLLSMLKRKQNQQEEGQGLVEYALILVLVAVVVIAILSRLGPQIGNIFSRINDVLEGKTYCVVTLTPGYGNMQLTVPQDILTKASLSGSGFTWQNGNNVLAYTAYSGPELTPELALFNTKTWSPTVVSAKGPCTPFPNK